MKNKILAFTLLTCAQSTLRASEFANAVASYVHASIPNISAREGAIAGVAAVGLGLYLNERNQSKKLKKDLEAEKSRSDSQDLKAQLEQQKSKFSESIKSEFEKLKQWITTYSKELIVYDIKRQQETITTLSDVLRRNVAQADRNHHLEDKSEQNTDSAIMHDESSTLV